MCFETGDVAPADLQQLCGLELGQRRLTGQTIPKQDEFAFPCRQALDELPQPGGLILFFAVVFHAETVLQNVRQGQRGVILSGFQRLL